MHDNSIIEVTAEETITKLEKSWQVSLNRLKKSSRSPCLRKSSEITKNWRQIEWDYEWEEILCGYHEKRPKILILHGIAETTIGNRDQAKHFIEALGLDTEYLQTWESWHSEGPI